VYIRAFGWRACRVRLLAVASAVLGTLVCCGGTTTTTTPSSPGPTIEAGQDAEPLPCSLDAGTCERSDSCCPLQARFVDLEQKCVVGNYTVFSCEAKRCPPMNAEEGCYQRMLANGTIETYSTETTSGFAGYGSQFTACSASLAQAVSGFMQRCR